jgi:RNA-directed DNA polymerase
LTANLILSGIAPRIEWLCLEHKLKFFFYQDDLTISDDKRAVAIKRLLSTILRQQGFKIDQRKLILMRNIERHEVTGLVVNKKVNISKDEYRSLRAIHYQCRINGLDVTALKAVERNKVPEKVKKIEREMLPERLKQHIYGRILRAVQINPDRGKKLLAEQIRIFG